MPKLVRLYIRHCAIGFAVAAAFVALLLWSGIGGLGALVARSDAALLAVLMLWVMNGIVFAGVQFAWAIMAMATRDDPPEGGHLVPVRVAKRRDHQTTVGY